MSPPHGLCSACSALGSPSLPPLLAEVRACTICAEHLPAGPRPILQVASAARIVIIGQAPGRRVHESGIPWDDPSGVRLRAWLGLSEEQFYDPELVALIPMGFCYPGSAKSGDNPPRPECAPQWHDRLLAELPDDRFDIIIGMYAQKRYIADRGKTLTDTVANWRGHLPHRAVLPHPSPRNVRWFITNPWFEEEVVPAFQKRVQEVLR
ncbi:MAG: uracil-DNA glycosylase family protein [Acidimicrobiales bacterium]|nr:MAG: uracil-DNA glycosylase family protein [Acidimicrobiales bacterium]